jgi:hypothetical protein
MSPRRYSSRHARSVALLSIASLSIAATIVGSAALAAPSPKVFRADVDGVPDPIPAGSTATIHITLFNDSTQLLGSSDIVAPAGYVIPGQTIAIVPPKTATVVGSTVQLRNLAISPGSSLSIEFTAVAPCQGNGAWTVDARKAADHTSGPFVLDATGSDLVTDTTGICRLGFTTQPANAELGASSATESEAITGAPYDPSGPAVAVEVLDGANQRIATSTAQIALSLGGGTAGAVLRLGGSTDVSAAAVQGVATFPGLTVDLTGFDYTLSATSSGINPAASAPFSVVQFGQVCSGETCSSPMATNPSDTGSGGVLATNVPPGLELAIAFAGDDPCAGTGYVPVMPDTFTVLALENGQPSAGVVLEVTLVLFNDTVLASGRRLPELKVCFATDVPGKTFVDSTGAQVTQGLLPNCIGGNTLNCVVSRAKDRATGDVTIVFRVLDGRGKT